MVWVGEIGKDNEEILNYILENYNFPIIIDADGLNILSKMDKSILNRSKSKIILTPHLKEFERLTNISIDEIQNNREKIALEFAKKYNVILLLKGSTTLVTDGNEIIHVTKGCAGMSTAGSGDVLSGILVGMLGYNKPNLLTVAGGAYLAGLAGELAQKEVNDISMMAHDTINQIPNAINLIRKS